MEAVMQSILRLGEKLYSAKVTHKNALGNSANMIFEMTTPIKPIILRISEYSGRKKEHIDFELNWMAYLSDQIHNIARPIVSGGNRLYEIVETDGKKYILCAFEKAKGRPVNVRDANEFNPSLWMDLGSIMGHMHRMTQSYEGCSEGLTSQFAWYNSAMFWPEYNTVIDEEVQPYAKKYIRELHSLPRSKETFGIIHEDIHHLNFLVHEGRITIFDFDDCHFSWYANDIAVTLFQFVQAAVPYQNIKERIAFAEAYLLSYLKGYVETNILSGYWIRKFDIFMKYRRTMTYKFVQNIFKDQQANPHEEYLRWMKNEILLDTPFVEIDYDKIIRSMPRILST